MIVRVFGVGHEGVLAGDLADVDRLAFAGHTDPVAWRHAVDERPNLAGVLHAVEVLELRVDLGEHGHQVFAVFQLAEVAVQPAPGEVDAILFEELVLMLAVPSRSVEP